MTGSTYDTTWTIEQAARDPFTDPEDTHPIDGTGTDLGSTATMKIGNSTELGQTPIIGAT
jgi:hypothetical protein